MRIWGVGCIGVRVCEDGYVGVRMGVRVGEGGCARVCVTVCVCVCVCVQRYMGVRMGVRECIGVRVGDSRWVCRGGCHMKVGVEDNVQMYI